VGENALKIASDCELVALLSTARRLSISHHKLEPSSECFSPFCPFPVWSLSPQFGCFSKTQAT